MKYHCHMAMKVEDNGADVSLYNSLLCPPLSKDLHEGKPSWGQISSRSEIEMCQKWSALLFYHNSLQKLERHWRGMKRFHTLLGHMWRDIVASTRARVIYAVLFWYCRLYQQRHGRMVRISFVYFAESSKILANCVVCELYSRKRIAREEPATTATEKRPGIDPNVSKSKAFIKFGYFT